MSITASYYYFSSVIGKTPVSMTSNTTTKQSQTFAGLFQVVVSDRGGLSAPSDFEVALWEKVTTGSAQTSSSIGRITGPNSGSIWFSPTFILTNGWDFTIQLISGTSVAFDWSVRRVSGIISQSHAFTGTTIGTAEVSLATGGTSIASYVQNGFFQLFVEPHLVPSTSCFEVQLLEKSMQQGVQRRQTLAFFSGSQREMFVSPAFLLMDGWNFTIKKNSGTDTAFAWSIRAVP